MCAACVSYSFRRSPIRGPMSFPTFQASWYHKGIQSFITEPEHGMSEDKKKEKKEKKDPYSKTAQEKARLEAQQRLMGIDTNKKPKKKTKKKILGVKTRLFRPLLVLNEVNYLFCFSCAWPNLPMAIFVLQKETLKGKTFHENGPDVPIQSARRSVDWKNVGDVLK